MYYKLKLICEILLYLQFTINSKVLIVHKKEINYISEKLPKENENLKDMYILDKWIMVIVM